MTHVKFRAEDPESKFKIIAVNLKNHHKLRQDAISKIRDQYFLKSRALRDPHPIVRAYAVDKITYPDWLQQIAKKDGNPIVRIVAIMHIYDRSFLETRKVGDQYPEVRKAAESRLQDLLRNGANGSGEQHI